jgi:hypothetical protein
MLRKTVQARHCEEQHGIAGGAGAFQIVTLAIMAIKIFIFQDLQGF